MIAILYLSLLAAAGDPPEVHYTVKLETRAWEPIALAELTPVVDAAAAGALTKTSAMRLQKTGFGELESGDYAILIQGRFIEEAERFAIYVGFQKGKREDLPSFHVAEGVELSGANKGEILKRIEDAARRAATRMAALLKPRLEAVRLSVEAPPMDEALPWTWGSIEVPTIAAPTKAMKDLLDVANPDHIRHQALTELEGHVFDQKAAKNVMERVVLTDPTPGIRARAARALAPVARTSAPTQSVLLHAMRTEVDEEVLGALTELSSTFVGLSKKEALETWLELVSSDATPPSAASRVAELLAAEEEVPNLEIAVSVCLGQEALIYGKKSACASNLLRKIPESRRLSVAWRYLSAARVFDLGGNNVIEEVLETVAGRSEKPISLELAGLLLGIAERPSAGAARRRVFYPLWRHPAPDAAAVERMLVLVRDPELALDAIRTLTEWCSRHPELRTMTAGALERLRADVSYLVKPSHGNPYEEIDKAIVSLRRERR